jgi:hypothetical protein
MSDDLSARDHAADGVTEGALLERRGTAWIGTRIDTGAPVPVTGAWEIVEHPDDGPCLGLGDLRGLGRGETAPGCPRCGRDVVWQLGHLALAVVVSDRPDPASSL